ncbi:hypothetical protein DUI87_07919 [Hirundo rustica rustica]|uniref:Uncharacterized protein n=1 Tax=Hirundo rustica rustica TaxID=333673 RepID=A0A3M0KS14_HIRRU|nr:hypothetical protein DUI87_07919 [Hirundo rustica rustica]
MAWFLVAEEGRRSSFCKKLLEAPTCPTEPISDDSEDGHAAGPTRECMKSVGDTEIHSQPMGKALTRERVDVKVVIQWETQIEREGPCFQTRAAYP